MPDHAPRDQGLVRRASDFSYEVATLAAEVGNAALSILQFARSRAPDPDVLMDSFIDSRIGIVRDLMMLVAVELSPFESPFIVERLGESGIASEMMHSLSLPIAALGQTALVTMHEVMIAFRDDTELRRSIAAASSLVRERLRDADALRMEAGVFDKRRVLEALAPGGPHGKGEPKHILVIEDRPSTLAAVVRDLQSTGHQVTQVASVADAISTLKAEHVDLMILDWRIPLKHGAPDPDGGQRLLQGIDELGPLAENASVPYLVVTAQETSVPASLRKDPRCIGIAGKLSVQVLNGLLAQALQTASAEGFQAVGGSTRRPAGARPRRSTTDRNETNPRDVTLRKVTVFGPLVIGPVNGDVVSYLAPHVEAARTELAKALRDMLIAVDSSGSQPDAKQVSLASDIQTLLYELSKPVPSATLVGKLWTGISRAADIGALAAMTPAIAGLVAELVGKLPH